VPEKDRRLFTYNDNISHFICRLAYCRNEELRKWFLTQEQRLFNLRLKAQKPEDIRALLEKKVNIVYAKVEDQEWERFSADITFNAR
jgi:DNA primase large subunit